MAILAVFLLKVSLVEVLAHIEDGGEVKTHPRPRSQIDLYHICLEPSICRTLVHSGGVSKGRVRGYVVRDMRQVTCDTLYVKPDM